MNYFIREEGSEFVKIGYTAEDPLRRLGEIQTGNPRKLILEAIEKGDEKQETLLHKRFKAFHHRREWFYYSREIRMYAEQAKTVEETPDREASIKQQQARYYTERLAWIEENVGGAC